MRVLRSHARHTASAIGDKPVAQDASDPGDPISRQTVNEYLSALTRIFVLEDLPAWAPTLRATDRVRKTPSTILWIRHWRWLRSGRILIDWCTRSTRSASSSSLSPSVTSGCMPNPWTLR